MTQPPNVEATSAFTPMPSEPVRDPSPALPGAPRSESVLLWIALALSITIDALTNEHAPGIGLTVFVLLAIVAVAALTGRYGLALASRWRWLAIGAIAALGLVFTYRDSTQLLIINTWAIFVAVLLLSVRVLERRFLQVSLLEFLFAAVELPLFGIVRTCQAFGRVCARLLSFTAYHAPETGQSVVEQPRGRSREIALGILIAIPVLIIFTALLAAADEGFSRLVGNIFDWPWDLPGIATHIVIITVCSLGVGAVLISALAAVPLVHRPEGRQAWATDIIVWIVLGSLILLFATYLVLQAGYFFGGASYLAEQAHLTAAGYARRGFIELLVVAALVVPLLLGTRQYANTEHGQRAFRVTGPVLAFATLGLIASAIARLWIYQDRFGLTLFRINAAVIVIWIALGLAWLGTRIALGRTPQLASFAAIVGIALILVMDIVNPSALVARTNLDRTDQGGIDVTYLTSLGADAVPTLVDRRGDLTMAQRVTLDGQLERHGDYERGDWRNWNLARAHASDAVSDEIR